MQATGFCVALAGSFPAFPLASGELTDGRGGG